MSGFSRTRAGPPDRPSNPDPNVRNADGSDDDLDRSRPIRGSGTFFCNTCAHEWTVPVRPAGRFASIEDLVRRIGLRRDELMTLADIGALNAFTNERRSALWQADEPFAPRASCSRSGKGDRGSEG